MATVYFLRSGNDDLFKIGITRGAVEDRRKALSTGKFATNTLPIREMVAEAAKLESDGRVLVPGEEEVTTCQELAAVNEQIYRLTMLKEMLESRLKLRLGSAAEFEGLVSWKTEERNTLDTPALKDWDMNIYTRFLKPTRSRKFRKL